MQLTHPADAEEADPDLRQRRQPPRPPPGRRSRQDLSQATATRSALSASSGGQRLGPRPSTRSTNAAVSAMNACPEPIEKSSIWVGGGRWTIRLDRVDGSPAVHSHHDRISRAEDLRAEVVSDRVVAGAGDDNREPVVHRQDHRRRVDVVLAAVGLPGPDGAGRKYLFDLAAGQPPRHVEVVDVQIAEDPAAGRDVPLVGRLVVVSTHPQRVQGPGGARGDELARAGESRHRTGA